MRTLLTMIAVTAVSFLILSGCGQPRGVGGLDASQSRPEWTLELKSTCKSAPADQCTAAYSYSVGADGSFKVGPGPQGQVLTGKLTNEENADLQKLYIRAISSTRNQGNKENCTKDSAGLLSSGESSAQVHLITRAGAAEDWVEINSQKHCTRFSDGNAEDELLEFLRTSAENHYPLPFPDDACDGATAALEILYGNVRTCRTDADCSYIDDDFQLIAKDHFTFLVTNDCTGAEPLVVGNASLVGAKRTQLLQASAHAKDACKQRSSVHCSGFSDFQPTEPAPVCGGGICRPRRG